MNRAELVQLQDIPPAVMRALANMPAPMRDAWIDQYMLGHRLNSWGRDRASQACERLRNAIGTSETLKDAA